jgi:hypothetical protein
MDLGAYPVTWSNQTPNATDMSAGERLRVTISEVKRRKILTAS